MSISPGTAIFLSILMLLGMRGVFGLHLSFFQSRKAARVYRTNVPFWDRWFFISAPLYVRDKYSKLERKVIKARAFVHVMRAMNLLLHGLLLPVATLILLHGLNMVDGRWADWIFQAYIIIGVICFLIACIVDISNHREAERIRNGRKRINW